MQLSMNEKKKEAVNDTWTKRMLSPHTHTHLIELIESTILNKFPITHLTHFTYSDISIAICRKLDLFEKDENKKYF